jgi:hypothetical protein
VPDVTVRRRVIGVAAFALSLPNTVDLLVAACDDGSVWKMDPYAGTRDEWTELPPVPGTVRAGDQALRRP